MDKGNYCRPFGVVGRSRWLGYLESLYIIYVVLQMSL